MKILLTGSNGFLGKEIIKGLSSHNVSTLNRGSGDYIFDLSKSIPKFDHNFDLVIHAAGKAHTFPKSNEDRNRITNINVVGTKNLLKGLSKVGVPKRFVFISSVSVYGLLTGNNINEETKLNADDSYGKSKIEAEKLVSEWCIEHNVICTILRLPLVVGLNPPGNLGAMIDGIQKGYYFNVGGGKAKKSMVLASDVSTYLISASEVGGVFNLTDGIHPSFYDLSKCISIQFNKKYVPNLPMFVVRPLAFLGDLVGLSFPINSFKLSKITSTLTFDDTKAKRAFKWKPKSVLEKFKVNE
jgi:nucleoside-diphosphate-sugar epimerase